MENKLIFASRKVNQGVDHFHVAFLCENVVTYTETSIVDCGRIVWGTDTLDVYLQDMKSSRFADETFINIEYKDLEVFNNEQ